MIVCATAVVILRYTTSDKVSRARPMYKVRSTIYIQFRFHRFSIALYKRKIENNNRNNNKEIIIMAAAASANESNAMFGVVLKFHTTPVGPVQIIIQQHFTILATRFSEQIK